MSASFNDAKVYLQQAWKAIGCDANGHPDRSADGTLDYQKATRHALVSLMAIIVHLEEAEPKGAQASTALDRLATLMVQRQIKDFRITVTQRSYDSEQGERHPVFAVVSIDGREWKAERNTGELANAEALVRKIDEVVALCRQQAEGGSE